LNPLRRFATNSCSPLSVNARSPIHGWGEYNTATTLASQEVAMLKMQTPEAAKDEGSKKGESG
jgi:hypothetical protein